MTLNGLKKSEQNNQQQEIDEFIGGVSKRIRNLKTPQKKYRRLTFSLTDDINKEIDDLLLDCKVARANRSLIVKAAIRHLKNLPEDKLHELVVNEMY